MAEKIQQHIILFSICLAQGPPIMPAEPGEPPVILSEDVIFADPSDEPLEQRRARLIAAGVILPIEQAEKIDETKAATKETEKQATRVMVKELQTP